MARQFQFFVNGIRAYTLTLEKDLLGDLIIRRTWGPKQNPYSQKRVELFDNESNALSRFEALVGYRIKNRHYELAKKTKTIVFT